MTTPIKSTIETVEIVRCTTGFIMYLHDGRGEVIATKAISNLGYSGYSSGSDSLLSCVEAAFKPIETPSESTK
jgi:hypothetical protein